MAPHPLSHCNKIAHPHAGPILNCQEAHAIREPSSLSGI